MAQEESLNQTFGFDSAGASVRFVQQSGQAVAQLTVSDSGSLHQCEVHLFGAHATRWCHINASDRLMTHFLFLSKKAVLDGTKAIRGGIPVIFPQFSDIGPLKSHGLARTSVWSVLGTDSPAPGTASLTLQLVSDEETRKIWPHSFETRITFTLSSESSVSSLTLDWSVKNTGSEPFSFTGALHTYFDVGDITKCSVSRLGGLQYMDNLQGRQICSNPANQDASDVTLGDSVRFDRELDRIYLDCPNEIDVKCYDGRIYRTTKDAQLPDAVVWNPWVAKARATADLDDEEFLNMVCVEPAVIQRPAQLPAGQEWTTRVAMTVHR